VQLIDAYSQCASNDSGGDGKGGCALHG
jgi:hypothetical protein